MGRVIRDGGLPKSIGPFVICVTGYVDKPHHFLALLIEVCRSSGQVSNGVLSLLNELPVKMITKDELPNLVMDPSERMDRLN